MNLTSHLTATGLACIPVMLSSTPADTVLFSVGSVLIDLDHYIFYYCRTGRHDISGMFRYFREDVDQNLHSIPYLGVCIFHTAEFFLLIAAISLFLPDLKYLLAGLVFHVMLDIYDLIRLKVPFIRAYSLIEHLVRRKMAGYPFV